MRRGRARPKTTNTTVTIPVATLTAGAQAVDAFAGWDSPAATVEVHSGDGGGSNVKYLRNADATYFLAKTKGVSRDQEITTYAVIGAFYLRLTEGRRAWRFKINTQTNSYSVDLVDLKPEGTSSGDIGPGVQTTITNYTFSVPLPAIGTVPGWDRTANAGKAWTFGVEGIEIYLKYDGVEFWRATTFGHVSPGRMAVGCHPDTGIKGFRDVSAVFKTDKRIHSDTYFRLFDLRDLGMKSLKATGSILAGGYVFNLDAANPGFSVGDQVCIEVGGEAGGGVPGERGVGGQWPSLLYATNSARDSDTTQVTNKVCGVLATGATSQWNGSAWVPYAGGQWKYHGKILPKALIAKITGVAGAAITLDTAATANATGATIYFDSGAIAQATLLDGDVALRSQPGCTVFIPPGDDWVFAGKRLNFGLIDGIQVIGAGVDDTTIRSPRGTAECGILVQSSTAPRVAHMTFEGNTRSDAGYMFRYDATTDQFSGSMTFVLQMLCADAVTEHIRGRNYSNAVSEFAYGTDCLQRFIEVIHDTGHKQYFQWAVNISDSTNCVSEDITFDGPYLFKGLESFRSTGSILRRATGRNAILSSNSNADLLMQECSIVYEAGAGDNPADVGVPSASRNPSSNEPLVNLNSNIDNTSGSSTGSGLVVEYCDFDVQGRLWSDAGVIVIGMSGTTTDVTVRGRYPAKPAAAPSGRFILPDLGADLASGGTTANRSMALASDTADGTFVVDGVRIESASSWGAVGNSNGNHLLAAHTLRNSVVDATNIPETIDGTLTGNITNAAYEAL